MLTGLFACPRTLKLARSSTCNPDGSRWSWSWLRYTNTTFFEAPFDANLTNPFWHLRCSSGLQMAPHIQASTLCETWIGKGYVSWFVLMNLCESSHDMTAVLLAICTASNPSFPVSFMDRSLTKTCHGLNDHHPPWCPTWSWVKHRKCWRSGKYAKSMLGWT